MISVGSLAFGYLIMNIFAASSNLSGYVCSTLFGSTSILTLTEQKVWLSVILSIVMVLAFVAFYHKIFAAIFIFTLIMSQNLTKASAVDIDLIKMSSTMVYSTVFNMVNKPTNFMQNDENSR